MHLYSLQCYIIIIKPLEIIYTGSSRLEPVSRNATLCLRRIFSESVWKSEVHSYCASIYAAVGDPFITESYL